MCTCEVCLLKLYIEVKQNLYINKTTCFSLSGVSSILGEIFVKGHLKAEDVGLTQDAADRLARKAV